MGQIGFSRYVLFDYGQYGNAVCCHKVWFLPPALYIAFLILGFLLSVM